MHIINIYMLLPFRPFGKHFSILGLWVLSDAYWVKIRLQRLTAAGRDRLSDTIRHKDQPEICWKSNVHLFWWKQSSEKHLLNWISVKWEKLHTRFLQDNMAKIQPSIYFQIAPFINNFFDERRECSICCQSIKKRFWFWERMKNGRAESATADTIGPSATMDRELEWEISLIIGQYVSFFKIWHRQRHWVRFSGTVDNSWQIETF